MVRQLGAILQRRGANCRLIVFSFELLNASEKTWFVLLEPRFRKPLLYPAELRDQLKNFVSGYFLGTVFCSLNIPSYSMRCSTRFKGRDSGCFGRHPRKDRSRGPA